MPGGCCVVCRNTGVLCTSSLLIDPVTGHGHTPVYAPYESDDEDFAREQIAQMSELKVKLAEAKNEEEA
eukprot:scaffold236143_cov14-Prasinocladus_malaysianus.AAC.1